MIVNVMNGDVVNISAGHTCDVLNISAGLSAGHTGAVTCMI